jgi:hypothetical protein
MSISASMDDPALDRQALVQLESQSKKLQRTAEDNTPEGIFPYVLYLLSRPPAFPSGAEVDSEAGKKLAESSLRSLRMVSVYVWLLFREILFRGRTVSFLFL